MGNSLKPDNSLGRDSAFYTLKGNAYSSDFGNVTSKSHFNDLISLNSPVTADIVSRYNFGANKLIPRKATSLITSQKILDLGESLIDQSMSEVSTDLFYDSFSNFSFEQNYPAKPDFVNHQLTFFSSLSNFQNSLNFLNTPDLNYCLANPSKTISNSAGYHALKLHSHVLNNSSPENLPFNQSKLNFFYNNFRLLTSSAGLPFSLVADQDFKRWSANELLEDLS